MAPPQLKLAIAILFITNITLVENLFNQTSEPAEDLVNRTSGPAEDLVNQTSGPAEDLVNQTSGPAEDLVNQTSGPAEDLVNQTSGPAEDLVNQTSEPAKDLVDQTSEPVEDLVNRISGPAEDLINQASEPAEDLVNQTSEPHFRENSTSTYELDHVSSTESSSSTTTLAKSTEIFIRLSHALPGTKYKFRSALITTAPEAPSNFSVNIVHDITAILNWEAPTVGGFSGFKIELLNYSENGTMLTMNSSSSPYILENMATGSYQVQVFTMYDGLESMACVSHNFTVKLPTSGKFILWFRNETALMVLWHPNDLDGFYKISIDPADATEENVVYVECEGDPPGPARAGFKHLVPGRLYNISVEPMDEDRWPISVQYRTIPLPPSSLLCDLGSLTSTSVRLSWKAPEKFSDFDRYQITIRYIGKQNGIGTKIISRDRDEPTIYELDEVLKPGEIYLIEVRTVSIKMSSSPVSLNMTMKPSPVKDLAASFDPTSGGYRIKWIVDNSSYQEVFQMTYFNTDSSSYPRVITFVAHEHYDLDYLQPGGNYSISMVAISNGVKSNRATIYVATPPSSPVFEKIQPMDFGLDITWRSAYDSVQDYYIVIASRNDSMSDDQIISTAIEPRLKLTGLYPGAEYNITIIAVRHGLRSEAQSFFQAVRPKPPRYLTQRRTGRYSMLFRWQEPIDSIFDQYSIWIRAETDAKWLQYTNLKGDTEIEFTNLLPNLKYLVQVDTVSRGVRSTHSLWSNIIL